MKKRTAAMILAIMMVFSAMPNIAFAEQSVLTTRVSYSNGSAVSTETEETVDYYIVIPEAAREVQHINNRVSEKILKKRIMLPSPFFNGNMI